MPEKKPTLIAYWGPIALCITLALGSLGFAYNEKEKGAVLERDFQNFKTEMKEDVKEIKESLKKIVEHLMDK